MKRLWAAAFLALLLAFFCTYPTISTQKHCVLLEQLLEDAAAQALAGDSEAALRASQLVQQHWKEWIPEANCYLTHSELDPVGEALGNMDTYLCGGQPVEFAASCRLAQTILRHLADSDPPRWGNIL